MTTIRDLHTHSSYSDGLCAPGELIAQAAREGVSELSLTDHDTILGLEEAREAAQALGIAFAPGVELTARHDGRVVHLLGYGFDPAAAARDLPLTGYLERVRARDHAWATAMCRASVADPILVTTLDRVQHAISVSPEEIAWARGTIPSAFPLAVVISHKLRALSDELAIPPRHCLYLFTGRLEPERRRESFWPGVHAQYATLLARYRIEAGPHWWIEQPTGELLDADRAIAALRRIGGLPVLAHPGEQKVGLAELARLAEQGVRGVEVYTYKHTAEETAMYREAAESLSLLPTAGTDFHDPHHRALVRLGRDREGRPLTEGMSLADLRAMGAVVYRG